ncbi:MAG TPA: hypothetical protein VII00_06035 [bacterium]
MTGIQKKEEKTLLIHREEWLSSLNVDGKEEKLFELEMLLKATERYFNLDNLTISSKDNIMARNFYYEIKILKSVVHQIVALIQTLFNPAEAKAFYFQSYVESKLIKDYARDKFADITLRQEDPKSSLFVLLNSFVNIMEVLNGVSMLKKVPYTMYFNLGQIVSREIYINRYFNPFKLSAFSRLYDRVTSEKLQSILNSIKDEPLRKHLTIPILAFFRFIRYLKYVRSDIEDLENLKSFLPVFSLINSEVRSLWIYIEKEIPEELEKKAYDKPELKVRRAYLHLLDSLSFQINMELKKTFMQIMKDASEINYINRLRIAIDNSKGLLTNFFQQTIVSIIHLIRSGDLNGADIFPDFVSRLEQSMRLREDIWIFHELARVFEKDIFTEPVSPEDAKKSFNSLAEFIRYFKNLSYNLIRISDIDAFDEFFQHIDEFSIKDFSDKLKVEELKRPTHIFRIFLSTTISHINHRQELKNFKLDEQHALDLMKQFY